MAKINETAPKKRDLKLPECTGCSQCGDAWEDRLYLLGYNGQYYCRECFYKIAVKWPKKRMGLPVSRRLVERYLGEIRGSAQKAGKKDRREGRNVSLEETELDRAVECALVKMLTGQEPDTGYRQNWNDGGIDGTFSNGVTFDVKCTTVRSNWEGIRGFNSPVNDDGRVTADLLIAALVMGDLSRIEAIGWCKRDAPMRRVAGLDKPAYPREDLERNDIYVLAKRAEELYERASLQA